jgi:hypothetical protein
VDDLRKAAIERHMIDYFADLKKRYPVRVYDKTLEAIPLPEPPED